MKAPGTWTAEGLFAGRPAAFALFRTVRRFIESLGQVTIEASKTQISFGRERKFAWIWQPQTWIKKRPKDSITIAFDLPDRIRHARIAAAVEPRPGRWTHHVLIKEESDFDDDVRHWLRRAYDFGLKAKPRSALRPDR